MFLLVFDQQGLTYLVMRMLLSMSIKLIWHNTSTILETRIQDLDSSSKFRVPRLVSIYNFNTRKITIYDQQALYTNNRTRNDPGQV